MKLADAGVVESAWKRALEFWGGSPQLHPPVDVALVKDGSADAIAYISMASRQVVYNRKWFEINAVVDTLPAVFAHELAHHLRFPHSLRVSAELHLLGEAYIPGLPFSYLNLFWDLLVNHAVGQDAELRKQLVAVYDASLRGSGGEVSELFKFYLCIYEELWGIQGHYKLSLDPALAKSIPRFTQEFYQLENFYDQFIYFLSQFVRYLPSPEIERQMHLDPFFGDALSPSAGDYPPGGEYSGAMKRALERAAANGWIKAAPASDGKGEGAYRRLQRALAGLPGDDNGERAIEAGGRFYRALVEKHIEELPKTLGPSLPDMILPSVTESWDIGDDMQDIDWQESIARGGRAAAMQLLKRDRIADDPSVLPGKEYPQVEIYLDTSGSMPSPVESLNMMTLAAQILAAYAIRRGGRVRGVVYSSGNPEVSDWMQSEERARRFFLNYIGGGTEFPFRILEEWTAENAQVFRVIISDGDFLNNLGSSPGAPGILQKSAAHSRAIVTLLANVNRPDLAEKAGTPLFQEKNFRHVCVHDQNDFARISAELARALLGKE